ncbi:hypothetical protein FBZ98_1021095 [Rhizobium sp. ERR 922]|uniref:hypothetical protein n=1 Tax=unclassified Rhizobium TaxID=2613769 RepID=UPI000DDE81C5|nr:MULTISPECIES: hypothetical protein [unclassified Rhizobium]TWB58467.1 hypothetical protein FBZ98_1021095 [Rhizobium sp. ERR 922]TWC00163.1 hypothetical protein FBZ97_1021095 [Rhizobium sp. ERR 942]
MPIKKSSASDVFQRKISDFCDMRLKPLLQPRSFENIKGFMIGLIVFQSRPPLRAGRVDFQEIASLCGMDEEMSPEFKRAAQPGFDAILRWLGAPKTNRAQISRVAAPAVRKPPLRIPAKPASAQPERRALAS